MSDDTATGHTLDALRSSDVTRRLEAALALATVSFSSLEIVQALERAATSDDDPAVRASALEALSSPAHQRVQWHLRRETHSSVGLLPSRLREEIDAWQKDGLISAQTASLLRQRYPLAEPPAPIPSSTAAPEPVLTPEPTPGPAPIPTAPAAQPAQRATLSQVLLSEAAIRVALYLGAFFVVSAAFITAALVQVARLPILSITTVVLLGTGWALSRRLPTAAFALWTAGGLMIPIDAGVLIDLSKAPSPQLYSLWAAAFAISSVVWVAGTWRLSSRLFCLLAFISLDLAVFDGLQQWLTLDGNLVYLALAGVALAGLAAAWLVRRGGASKFFRPLFTIAQLQSAGLVLLSLITVVIAVFGADSAQPVTWWHAAGVWLALMVFYAASDLLVQPIALSSGDPPAKFAPLQVAAAFCLLLAPLVGLRALSLSHEAAAATTWAWGAILALSSEGLRSAGWKRDHGYASSLLWMAVPTMLLGVLIEPRTEVQIGYLAGAAVILTGLSARKLRWLLWSLALISWAAAYLTVFALPGIDALHLFAGYILVVPMSIFLTLDLVARKRWSLARGWTAPMLVMGILFMLLTGFTAVFEFANSPGSVALTLLVMTIFLMGYALLDGRVFFWMAALVVAYFAYLALLRVDAISRLHLPLGILYLPPGLVYLALYAITRRWSALKPTWWGSALVGGGLAAIIDMLIAALEPGARAENAALVYLLWAIVLGVFTLVETERLGWWAGALVMVYASYGAASRMDAVVALPIFAGFIHLLPALLFLTGDLVGRRWFHASTSWTLPPLVIGIIASLLTIAITISGAADLPERGLAVFLIFALYFGIYAGLDSTPWVAYLSAGAGVAAFTYFLAPWRSLDPNWAAPYTFLAVAYYVIGLALTALPVPRVQIPGKLFQLSGLILGAAGALVVFFQTGTLGVIGVALVATCVVVEAFRRRNIWLGYPANLLYLISYSLALRAINITEPQFYAIGAALLGLIMHYLLVRNKSVSAAFITGLISQLLLQSTSYIQMVASQELKFFAALFFESLAIMAYGLVIRSRSLLFIPIAFLIVGTATVAFTFLKGISTAAIIGITGIVLLGLGILALVMRERLVRLVAILNTWQP